MSWLLYEKCKKKRGGGEVFLHLCNSKLLHFCWAQKKITFSFKIIKVKETNVVVYEHILN